MLGHEGREPCSVAAAATVCVGASRLGSSFEVFELSCNECAVALIDVAARLVDAAPSPCAKPSQTQQNLIMVGALAVLLSVPPLCSENDVFELKLLAWSRAYPGTV